MDQSILEKSMLEEQVEIASVLEPRTLPGMAGASFFERGLYFAQRGCYTEAASFFTLAREELAPDQIHIAAIIDAFLQGHAVYWQAQQALSLANEHFLTAQREQQTQLLALEKLLPALREEHNTPPAYAVIAPPSQKLSCHSLAHAPSSSNGKHLCVQDEQMLPDLYISCFGCFEVRRCNQAIALCNNRSGQAILRYLMLQPGYRASRDALIDVLWREDPPEVAHRKLQIAVSALRRSLNSPYTENAGAGYILFTNQCYRLNPEVVIRTDVDEFLSLWQQARQAGDSEAIGLYERACNLCTGIFLAEDRYAEWSFVRREQLSQIHHSMCHVLVRYYLDTRSYEEAAKWASIILTENQCDEEAYRHLIRICIAQGRRKDALRYYQRCAGVLAEELGVSPMPETVTIYKTILCHDQRRADE